jgi:O-antigen/teichoic acid export membrane protein
LAASSRQAEGSFLRKAGPLVMARMAGAAITFAIPLVLARAMALEEYGTYKQLFLIAQTLYYILPFGVAQSLYFFIPRTDRARPWVMQTLAVLLLTGLCGGAVVLGLGQHAAALLGNGALLQYALPLAIYVACVVGAMPLEVTLTCQGRTRAAAVIYLGSDAVRAAAMIVPVFLGYGLWGAMNAMAAFAALRLVLTWAVSAGTTQGPLLQRGLVWRQVAYAAPFGAAMLLSIPQQYAHQYAVGATVPPELFALYAVGCFQLPLVDLLYSPTSEVLMVRVGELERQNRLREAVHAFREAASKLAYAFLPLSAFLFVAAPEFIGALFGDRFLGAVPIFRVSVLAIVLSCFPVDGLLRARNQTRYLFLSYLAKALVTVPLVWVGVRHFGMMGGILSWAAAELVGKVTLMLRIPRALDDPDGPLWVRVGRALPFRELGRASAAAVGAGVAVAALRELAPVGFAGLPDGFLWRALPLAVGGGLFAAGYLALLRAAGVRPLAVLASLRRRPA